MAASRFTGTDTDAFAYSNEGVASALNFLAFKVYAYNRRNSS